MAFLYYIRQDFYEGSDILCYFRNKEKAEEALKVYRLTADKPQDYGLETLEESDLGDSGLLFIYHEGWKAHLMGIERNEFVNVRWVFSYLTGNLVELQIPGVTNSFKAPQGVDLSTYWTVHLKDPPFDGYGDFGVWRSTSQQIIGQSVWKSPEVSKAYAITELPEWSQVKKKLQSNGTNV